MNGRIAKLTATQRQEIMRQNWISHDARWFLKTAQELGFDVANRLNHIVIRSMGKTEVKRWAQAVGLQGVKDIGQVVGVFDVVNKLYFPEQVYCLRVLQENFFVGVVSRCFVAEMVRQAGATNLYECACAARFEGWLEACGFSGAVTISKSIMKGKPECEILISIK